VLEHHDECRDEDEAECAARDHVEATMAIVDILNTERRCLC